MLYSERTLLPGLRPTVVNAKTTQFDSIGITLGGTADSMCEYLPKQHLLLGGLTDQYKNLYQTEMAPIKKYFLFLPMVPENVDIPISATAYEDKSGLIVEPQM